jgi:glycosyltransferase involved in cell wall biosynthesis
MRVFINIGPHPQYREIVDYPPKGIEYEIAGKTDVSKYYSRAAQKLRKRTNFIIKVFGVPRMRIYKTDADLIFSTRGILPITSKPWVTEMEHPYAYVGLDYKNWGIRQRAVVRSFLESDNCKKIMPNSTGAYIALENSFNTENIKRKLKTVYLAIHYKKIKKIKHSGIQILTITSWAYDRGFNIIKDIYPKLKKRYNINWTIKTDTAFLRRDQKFIDQYGIKVIKDRLSEEKMDELYGSSDIFLYPSFVDTNSIVNYEAMRAALPVVATDIFGFTDKIIPYHNGLLIHDYGIFWNKNCLRTGIFDLRNYHNQKMSADLYEKLEYLIKNKKERLKLGHNAETTIKSGFLSIGKRNEKLKKIFESAVK